MLKRLFDVICASAILVMAFPLLLLIAVLLRCKLGRGVLFKQVRPGLCGKPFIMWKFRTMTSSRDGAGQLLPDNERLTRFGSFIRSTSLDELPELWNVIKGDMSLVGPRPLLVEYLPLYSADQSRRHEVRPGITGWAQVNGRNAISWEEKFSLDVWYVDHQSFWLDMRILALTLKSLWRREGVAEPGHATASKFTGTNS